MAEIGLGARRASPAARPSGRGASQRREDLAPRLAIARAEDDRGASALALLGGEDEPLREESTRLSARASSAARERAREDETRAAAAAQRVSRGELELETLREEAHRRRSRLASLTEIQDALRELPEGRARHHAGAPRAGRPVSGPGSRAVVADIVQPPPELETAVEAVLGERLGNIIVESHEVGVEAIEFLKSQSEGRSSFIPRGAARACAAPADRSSTTPWPAEVAVVAAEAEAG